MTEQLTFHPLADIFPLMEGEEFDALVADIKANGLHEPIVLFRGKILDGRNRYRALQRLGSDTDGPARDCFFHELKDCFFGIDGPDEAPEHPRNEHALAYVISKNIHRRHLTEAWTFRPPSDR